MRKFKLIIFVNLFLTSQIVIGQPKSLINKSDTVRYLPYRNGKCPFSINGKMGIIDSNNTILLPAEYARIWRNYNDDGFWAVVSTDKKEGILNADYKLIIPVEFDRISYIQNNFFTVQKNGKYSYIDRLGKSMNKWFDNALEFGTNQLAAVQVDKKWGFINQSGEITIQPAFEKVNSFDENNLAPVYLNNKWGFINFYGQFVISNEYENIKKPSFGLYPVKKNGKWGFINSKGEIVIDFAYEDAEAFYNELTIVKKNNRYGFINQKNEVIIPFLYKEAEPFYNDYSLVKKGHKFGFINKKNETILPFKYRYIMRSYAPGNAVAMVRVNRLTRLKWINIKGETVE